MDGKAAIASPGTDYAQKQFREKRIATLAFADMPRFMQIQPLCRFFNLTVGISSILVVVIGEIIAYWETTNQTGLDGWKSVAKLGRIYHAHPDSTNFL